MSDGKLRIDWEDFDNTKSEPRTPLPAAVSRDACDSSDSSSQNDTMAPPTVPVNDKSHQPITHQLPSTLLANKRIAGLTCAICHSTIELGQQIRHCEMCKLSFHTECWNENQGCATYGCNNAPDAKDQLPQAEISIRLDQTLPPPTMPSEFTLSVANFFGLFQSGQTPPPGGEPPIIHQIPFRLLILVFLLVFFFFLYLSARVK
jgi:hypothetical protein